MQELKQSTGVKVRIGPAVSPSDGVTPVISLTLGAADQAELLKHNGAATVDISGATMAAVSGVDGWYDLTLTTSYTDTPGLLDITIQDADVCLPLFKSFMVKEDYELVPYLERNAALIESQRGAHTWQGNLYFVDPINGDTHANGNRGGRSDPYDSVQDCHDNAVTDSNHDVIILVSGDTGVTTLSETVIISKRYCFIRGPGRDFVWTGGTGGTATIEVTADGVELSGFQVNTLASGNPNGIEGTSVDFLRVVNIWVNNTRGDGINLDNCDNSVICNNYFQETGQTGGSAALVINATTGDANYNWIHNNKFDGVSGHGVSITGLGNNHNTIERNSFHESGGYGISAGANADQTLITHNDFANNVSGEVNDSGTDTIIIESQNGTTTEERVWDRILSAATHNIANSAGRRLRQIASSFIWDGTAQGPGANGNQIQLDTGASAVDGTYDPGLIVLVGGSGMGQSRLILQYAGSTRMVTVDRDWKVAPDVTTEFMIFADIGREHTNEGLAQNGTSDTITLNTLAPTGNTTILGQTVRIRSGTGADQDRVVISYNGSTKVATVDTDWETTPDGTSAYVLIPGPGASLTALAEILGGLPTNITYNLDGSQNVITFDTGVTWTHVYDISDQLISITVGP